MLIGWQPAGLSCTGAATGAVDAGGDGSAGDGAAGDSAAVGAVSEGAGVEAWVVTGVFSGCAFLAGRAGDGLGAVAVCVDFTVAAVEASPV